MLTRISLQLVIKVEAVTQPIFREAATRNRSSQSSTNRADLRGFLLSSGLMRLYLILVSMGGYVAKNPVYISIAERIAKVPACGQQNDFGLVMPPFEWVFHEAASGIKMKR